MRISDWSSDVCSSDLTHARAIAAGCRLHGCTVHLVTPELDSGPIIAQAAVPVMDDATPDTLAARVLVEENRPYPDALPAPAPGSLRVYGPRVLGFDTLSPTPLI